MTLLATMVLKARPSGMVRVQESAKTFARLLQRAIPNSEWGLLQAHVLPPQARVMLAAAQAWGERTLPFCLWAGVRMVHIESDYGTENIGPWTAVFKIVLIGQDPDGSKYQGVFRVGIGGVTTP